MIKGRHVEDLMQEPSLDELEDILQTGLKRNVLAIRCKLGKWLDALPEEKRSKVQQLLDLDMSHAQVTLLIQKVFDVKKDIVRQHRTGICRCRN